MLHKRSRAILNKVLTEQHPVTVKQLSEAYKFSPRMIRYDLESIDDFLKTNKLPLLRRKGGIFFPGSEAERTKAIALMENIQSGFHLPENRIHQLISILLRAKGYTTYEEIAQKLDVSKNTVINDLNKLRSFYPYQSATIEVIPRHGICFSGDEADIRESVVSFLFGKSGIHDIFLLLHPGTKEDKFARCLQNIAKTFEVRLSDNAFVRLLLYMSVASTRMQSEHMISVSTDMEVSSDGLAAAEMAIAEIRHNSDFPGFFIKPEEYVYLGWLMAHYFVSALDNRAEIQISLLNLVNNMERLLDMDLMQDTQLLKTLDADIQAIAGKKELFLPSYENLGTQLLERYPDVYEAVKDSVYFIEKYIGRRLSPEELTHLMIPFAEAAQRSRTLAAGYADILVVCSAGLATSRLLCYQLTSLFNVNIVDAIDFNQLEDSIKRNNVDLIVSTVPLGQRSKPCILVSPFLTSQDLKALKAYLPTKVIDHSLFTSLIKAVERNCHVHNQKQLVEDIADILGIKGVEREKSKLSLCDILPPENILLDIRCDDWREAVEQGGELLARGGYVEAPYVEEMIKNVEQNGMYIVIAKGIAMPHAGLRSVRRVGMSLVRLIEPVTFGNADNDPVDLVFALCTPTKVAHLEALKQFSYLISDQALLKQIREAERVEEIVDVLSNV